MKHYCFIGPLQTSRSDSESSESVKSMKREAEDDGQLYRKHRPKNLTFEQEEADQYRKPTEQKARKSKNEYEAQKRYKERSKSPAKSPLTPPRSPNWKRYRDSPPHSSPPRLMSPPISPRDSRFTFSISDMSPPSRPLSRADAFFDPYEADGPCDEIEQINAKANRIREDTQGEALLLDKVPPKPAKALDLASYAATVANDTANMTNKSVSPITLRQEQPKRSVGIADDRDILDVSPDRVSPPSPNYYEVVDEVKVASKKDDSQTKMRPPADWSPVTDLSPIIDVSPSIERLEQEMMLAEQKPRSSIKRHPNFDNISALCTSPTKEVSKSGGIQANVLSLRPSEDESQTFSYNVLKSPITPDTERSTRSQVQIKEDHGYTYPITPPAGQTSPPRPQSPTLVSRPQTLV